MTNRHDKVSALLAPGTWVATITMALSLTVPLWVYSAGVISPTTAILAAWLAGVVLTPVANRVIPRE